MEKLLSFCLPNRKGEIELIGLANLAINQAEFQVIVNGVLIYNGTYEEARDIATEIFELNNGQRAAKAN